VLGISGIECQFVNLLKMIISRTTFIILVFVFASQADAGSLKCPKGTIPNGEGTPEVSEAWCERSLDRSMHGPYRAWWPNKKLGTTGQYANGVAVGRWTGWYQSGRIQGYEWFEAGKLIRSQYWDESGNAIQKLPRPIANP
jgi:hypothetical protein